MDLKEYRESTSEKERTKDLLQLIQLASTKTGKALDIGARDGYFSKILTKYFDNVIALDLEMPTIEHNKIKSVQGDITNLTFSENSFDFVFCAEVLEHIPKNLLNQACTELSRVSKKYLLIGVPYKQDIRVSRTTCYSCGKKNPPWGHVNSFDEKRLNELFPLFKIKQMSFVGQTNARTNFLSMFFMDLAGNPYGTYTQEEACINCGMKLKPPPKRNLLKKTMTRVAFTLQRIQKSSNQPHPNWIHILFEKI